MFIVKTFYHLWDSLLIGTFFILPLLVITFYLLRFLYNRFKEYISYSKTKLFDSFIGFWKFINILNISVVILFFIISLVKGQNLMGTGYNIPYQFRYAINIIGAIISATIIYGLSKKHKIGYYASIIFCCFSIALEIIYTVSATHKTLVSNIINIIGIIVNLLVIYYLNKHKKYFNISS